MSFLASLRAQHTPPSSKQLIYLLQPAPGKLSLQLCLVEPREARREPWCVQHAQLVHLPSFLKPEDGAILKALVEVAPQFLTSACQRLGEDVPWSLLAAILQSGRAVVDDGSVRGRQAGLAEARTVEAFWRIDHNGNQHLYWQWSLTPHIAERPGPTKPRAELATCFLGGQLFALDSSGTETRIHPCSSAYPEAALRDMFSQARHTLNPEHSAEFFQHKHASWSKWALPLPQALKPEPLPAQVETVLLCRSETNAQAETNEQLQLLFRWHSAEFCSLPQPTSTPPGYWNGASWRVLTAAQDTVTTILEQAEALLDQDFVRLRPAAADQPIRYHARNPASWRRLFIELQKHLEAQGLVIAVEPGFRQHYLAVEKWQVELQENVGSDSLDLALRVQAGGRDYDFCALLAELKHFNSELREHGALPLPGGEWLALSRAQVSLIEEEIGDLLGSREGGLSLPKSQRHRLAALQAALPEETAWQGAVNHLQQALNLRDTPFLLQQNAQLVQASLRPYQWLGVCWIEHLKNCGANGLLADDMGLGKTLQALTLLSLQHQQGQLRHPALVILPRSLLYNWAAEIKRFVPHLSCLVIHGQQRQQRWPELAKTHIVLTTYHSLVSDIEIWEQQAISWCILDEAQTIKNLNTQVNKAVNRLRCQHKLCLSGTPVENHLGELWALLDFLMPGCLGSHQEFQRFFQKPIEKEANLQRMELLRARVAPFMLRRSKDQIAKDLPAKTEISRLIPLHEQQQSLYEEIKNGAWQDLQEQLASTDNPGTQQVFVLSALLKLRQVCCDPALLGEAEVPSAKREHCLAMIEELVEEKRAVLVFSQFTRMLDILAAALDEKGIPWLMLTGKTHNRQALVDAFQAGEAPVFLISLKAGGTGLNLTRADTVIHYDPWWNKAAELQASDRAHRIGQERPVFVYKLIAQDSIEEKIAKLQERKALVSQQINQQAQLAGVEFSLKLEELLELLQEEPAHD